MKRLKRSLSLWLAVALIVSALYVPAFGSETAEDQQEPAVAAAEEVSQEEETVEDKNEDAAAIEVDREETSEDRQENPVVITDDENPADVGDGNEVVDVDEAEEEAVADTSKEDTEAAIPESVEEGESEEISNDSFNSDEGNTYTVTFDANGGYIIIDEYRVETYDMEFEAGFNDIGNLQAENDDPYMFFYGWSTEIDGDPIDHILNVESDTTVYALWKRNCKVTYDANGGYFDQGEGPVETFVDQMLSGYIVYTKEYNTRYKPENDDTSLMFMGWSGVRDGYVSDDIQVESDLTLYAVWSPCYTITYDAAGGYFNENGEKVATKDVKVPVDYVFGSEWTYNAYPENDDPSASFVHWSTEPGGEPTGEFFIINRDIKLYAVWSSYIDIIFDANGGYIEDSEGSRSETFTIQGTSGEELYHYLISSVYNDNSRLKFMGWSTEPDGSPIDSDTIVNENMTLYAVWGEQFVITTDANGGYFNDPEDGITIKEHMVEPGEWMNPYSFEDPENSDKSLAFAGWSIEKDGERFEGGLEVDSDMTFYAVWTKAVKVTFDANGGTFENGGNTWTEKVVEGRFIDSFYGYDHICPVYPDESKGFAGWSISKDGKPVDYGVIVKKDTTLYAVWNTYCTITYHAGEGKFQDGYQWDEESQSSVPVYTDTYQHKVFEGDCVGRKSDSWQLESPENMEFAGWSWTEGGELLSENEENNIITKDTDLFAIYKPLYTVTLHATEGTFEGGSDTYTIPCMEGEAFGDFACGYLLEGPEGRSFAGWSLTEGGEAYKDETTITGDTDLFATWVNLYTITFDSNGGFFREWEYNPETEEETVVKSYEHTEQYIEGVILDNSAGNTPYYEDEAQKIFAGWSTSRNGDPIGKTGYAVKGSVTLYAVWEKPVAVTFNTNGGLIRECFDKDTMRWIEDVSLSSWTNFVNSGTVIDRLYSDSFAYPVKEGMVFLGWTTSKDGDLIGNKGLTVDQATTLYAKWGKPCTVTFNANGGYYTYYNPEIGEVVETETNPIDYGVGFIINQDDYSPEYNKEGCTFGGWSLTKDGTPFGAEGYAVKGGETLYAVWRKLGWNQIGSGWKYAVADENDNISYYANRWALIDGKWYYFDKDEWMATGWRNVGGEWYFLKANGAMAANEWAKDSTGWCWMDASGKITKNKWIQDGGQWYYLKANGYMAANEWAKDSGGWYWMDGSGKITKNKWIQSGGQWYYLKANGYMAANEWAKDSGGWYWMDGSGKITRSQWIQSGGQWYYLKANGYMAANEWAKDSGGWYWMDGSGKITRSQWIQSGGQWYYLKANGYMAANEWAKDSGGWYWMDGSGKITRSQWVQTGGKWYYLGANGYMVTGTQRIGGKTYRFNSSGVWIQ